MYVPPAFRDDDLASLHATMRAARLANLVTATADGLVAHTRIGRLRDLPVTGDWDGNGTTDIGLWRPGDTRFRLLRADGTFEAHGPWSEDQERRSAEMIIEAAGKAADELMFGRQD